MLALQEPRGSPLHIVETIAPRAGLADEFDLIVADWEFSRLPLPTEARRDWQSRVRRLSLGLVALDHEVPPESFYAVRNLDRRTLDLCSPFVLGEVIPVLEDAVPTMTFRSNLELGAGIRSFLAERHRATQRVPVLVVDWIGDAMLFESLLPGRCKLLLLEDVPEIASELARPFLFRRSRHNALHDAMAIRDGVAKFLGRAFAWCRKSKL